MTFGFWLLVSQSCAVACSFKCKNFVAIGFLLLFFDICVSFFFATRLTGWQTVCRLMMRLGRAGSPEFIMIWISNWQRFLRYNRIRSNDCFAFVYPSTVFFSFSCQWAMEQFEQLLTCCVCLDRYRIPKLLPCQHSFCMEPCMEGLVDYVRRQVRRSTLIIPLCECIVCERQFGYCRRRHTSLMCTEKNWQSTVMIILKLKRLCHQ